MVLDVRGCWKVLIAVLCDVGVASKNLALRRKAKTDVLDGLLQLVFPKMSVLEGPMPNEVPWIVFVPVLDGIFSCSTSMS